MKIDSGSMMRRALVEMRADIEMALEYVDGALQQIENGLPGFKSGHEGGGVSDGLTLVERLATTSDEGRRLQKQMFDDTGRAYDHTRSLAMNLRNLGRPPAPPKRVKGDIPDGWCENHYKVLHIHEPTRRPTGRLCTWCERFAQAHEGVLPNRPLMEIAARRRINANDITRTMPHARATKVAVS